MFSVFLHLVVLLMILQSVRSSRILVYVPTLCHSHVSYNGHVADQLIAAGHEVVVMLIEVDPSIRSNGTSSGTVIRFDVGMEENALEKTLWTNPGPFEDSNPLNPRILLKLIRVSSIFVRACQLQADDLGQLIRQLGTFDLGLTEQYDACGFAVFKALGIPRVVWLSATAAFRIQPQALGASYPLSYVPELFSPYSDRMTFIDRILNCLIAQVTATVYERYAVAEEGKLFKFTNLGSLSRQSNLAVINSHPLIDFPMPTVNNIVYVAGLTVGRPRPLRPEWRSIVDGAHFGFILISFGAIAKTSHMSKGMLAALFAALDCFPSIVFIVKHDSIIRTNGVPRRLTNNVFVVDWIPQLDLIGEPRFLGIITHGGLSSIVESVYYSRPLILMPLFADHYKNAKVMEQRGMALIIDKKQFSRALLVSAIGALLNDTRYREQAGKYSAMLKSRLLDPDALLKYEIAKVLKSPGRRIDRGQQEGQWSNGDLVSAGLFILLVSLFY